MRTCLIARNGLQTAEQWIAEVTCRWSEGAEACAYEHNVAASEPTPFGEGTDSGNAGHAGSSSGCGCRTQGSPNPAGEWALVLVALGLLRRRR